MPCIVGRYSTGTADGEYLVPVSWFYLVLNCPRLSARYIATLLCHGNFRHTSLSKLHEARPWPFVFNFEMYSVFLNPNFMSQHIH